MKKTAFYSMVYINGQAFAKRQEGWTDGKYNFYKNRNEWYCIEPQTGLAAGRGETRAIARFFADMNASRIAELQRKPEWGQMCVQFRAAVQEVPA